MCTGMVHVSGELDVYFSWELKGGYLMYIQVE